AVRMRLGPGVPPILSATAGGVPGSPRPWSRVPRPVFRESSPPVPLALRERGNAGRAGCLAGLLEPAGRHHSVPPGGRGGARQLGRPVGTGPRERCALGSGSQRAGPDAVHHAVGRLRPATLVEREL